MNKIKRYIFIIISIIIIVCNIKYIIVIYNNSKLQKDLETAIENCKSYNEQINSIGNNNRALKLTIEQLNCSKDSIIETLKETQNKLNIKDSKLKRLQYIESSFSKSDTVVLKDTIFQEHIVNMDTTLYDEWYNIKVELKYPSTIIMCPEFKSIKHIIVSTKKETINPPKKFFLFRWFQKKHTVLNIDVIEQNPYINNQTSRYIEIVE